MKQKLKNKLTLHPIMTYLIFVGIIIVISGILSFIGIASTTYKINVNTLEYNQSLLSVKSLFNLTGIRYIFSSTVSNFMNFAPLSSFIIILIGFGVMEKSGFLKTAVAVITKKMKKNTVTFLIVFLSVALSIMGDLSYIVMLPLSACIFKYGRRNPKIGLIASFAGLSCGQGLSAIFTSVDSSLLTETSLAARIIDPSYRLATISSIFIMTVAVVLVSLAITWITEKKVANKIGKYQIPEEDKEDILVTRKEIKGFIFSVGAAILYILVFLYNIIPGLPFSGALLDNTQGFFIDKLFSYNSFFSNGFVFVVTIFFVILGLFYGIGSRTIKNHQDFIDTLGHSLDGTGKTLVLIFFASLFISLFKETNIGSVIVASLANLFSSLNFSGLPLVILLFLISAVATFFVPTSITKWSILAPVVVPVMMNAGISPEFSQVIFRFGESSVMGLTPLMAYFVIYLAMLNKYHDKDNSIPLMEALRYQIPYCIVTFFVLLTLIILWYVIGLPLGINGAIVL